MRWVSTLFLSTFHMREWSLFGVWSSDHRISTLHIFLHFFSTSKILWARVIDTNSVITVRTANLLHLISLKFMTHLDMLAIHKIIDFIVRSYKKLCACSNDILRRKLFQTRIQQIILDHSEIQFIVSKKHETDTDKHE